MTEPDNVIPQTPSTAPDRLDDIVALQALPLAAVLRAFGDKYTNMNIRVDIPKMKHGSEVNFVCETQSGPINIGHGRLYIRRALEAVGKDGLAPTLYVSEVNTATKFTVWSAVLQQAPAIPR